jgi:hypothetical protein
MGGGPNALSRPNQPHKLRAWPIDLHRAQAAISDYREGESSNTLKGNLSSDIETPLACMTAAPKCGPKQTGFQECFLFLKQSGPSKCDSGREVPRRRSGVEQSCILPFRPRHLSPIGATVSPRGPSLRGLGHRGENELQHVLGA